MGQLHVIKLRILYFSMLGQWDVVERAACTREITN